ncbi:MAG: arsenate reductase (glutaredoxin) [Magnetococcales bacterium]|nr:arsenate reductase (glutaredoxin) [Magnetococcales bacterium]
METIIYLNPLCSKCRQALSLLQGKGISPRVVEYLRTPPTREEIVELLAMLGVEPRELMRRKEAEYEENHLDDPARTREELIEALVRFPGLLERPVVVHKGRAIIGRPPERVLDLVG